MSLSGVAAYAQPGFYIPQSAKIYFKGDSSTIFSNVLNRGNFGVGEDAFLNFKGKTWENESSALLTDETAGVSGVGGWIRFLSNNSKQQIIGGYNAATKTGPAFSRIQIQNNLGVELTGSNAKVRREVLFSDGHIYLNDNTMVVGDNNPGIISGYDSTKYFITANTPGLGILVRENVRTSDGRVDFPIGTSINSFTPSAIRNVSAPGDDYYATVVDSVRDNLINGNNLQTRGVNKTWEIGKLSADLNGEIEVFLQHVITEEGSIFQANRNKAFVSAYTPGGWDIGYPQSLPDDGYLTTGNILTGSGTNRRLADNMVGTSFYFSKFTGTGDSLNTKLWFNAYRVNPAIVKAYWSTKPETRVNYFVIQRRVSSENQFSDIDTLASQVPNGGVSLVVLNYNRYDHNEYGGLSFYRLKTVNFDNSVAYSNIVVVANKAKSPVVTLWPNPTPNKFFIGISGLNNFRTIMIWDAVGQKMRQEEIAGRSIIAMDGLPAGSYIVGILTSDGTIVETKKLIVTGQ